MTISCHGRTLLLNRLQIKPVRAQREGNLVLITELDHQRFSRLCDKALEYSKEYIKESVRDYVDKGKFEIYWWEKEGLFFLSSEHIAPVPTTLRETILQKNMPKPKQKSRPSRLELNISFPKDKKTNILRIVTQYGIIYWSERNNLG